MEWSAKSGHNLQYARRKGLSGGTGDGKCRMAATARCTSFVCMAGSGSAHRCSSVYPGFGSIYFRFHTAWWDHWGACFLFMSYSLSISSNSCKLAALWKPHCLTAPSMWSGHPTGMWGSSEGPSPFCSMIVRNMGTSVVALKLTWTRLHFHVSCQVLRGLCQPLCPCRAYTYFFDGWRLHPKLPTPDHLPRPKIGASPMYRSQCTCTWYGTQTVARRRARDTLAVAAKNQPEDRPNTRRAAARACKYLKAMVRQYKTTSKPCTVPPAPKRKKAKELAKGRTRWCPSWWTWIEFLT